MSGDFNMKLNDLQKNNSARTMIERKYSDQTYDLGLNNNGRKSYMNKLGFMSKSNVLSSF